MVQKARVRTAGNSDSESYHGTELHPRTPRPHREQHEPGQAGGVANSQGQDSGRLQRLEQCPFCLDAWDIKHGKNAPTHVPKHKSILYINILTL